MLVIPCNAHIVSSQVILLRWCVPLQAVRQTQHCPCVQQIPPAVDVYVHRAGRTARAEADGLSIALVSPAEAPRFRALMAALQRPPPPEYPLVRAPSACLY